MTPLSAPTLSGVPPRASLSRRFYTLLVRLGMPLVRRRLQQRGKTQVGYLQNMDERFGVYPRRPARKAPLIWIHGVSVGETRAAAPLMAALRLRYPDHDFLFTVMTPTGRDAAEFLYSATGTTIAYAPYDHPEAVQRFLNHYRPSLGILMETELWPNLVAETRAAGIPLVLANARLSAKSARGYRRFRSLARETITALSAIAAQTQEDAERFVALGARRIAVCGNLKFDQEPPTHLVALGEDWKAQFGQRPAWLAASTREGEEALILDAYANLGMPRPLLILVPRHPNRFDAVAKLVRERGLSLVKRSEGLPEATTRVWLGDSMGELPAYYTAATLAYIGGSLLPLGGQNLIEAAACGCPVLVGPHTFNFAQATRDAVAAGAAKQVADAEELGETVAELLVDPLTLSAMGAAAREFAHTHGGATARTLEVISRIYAPPRAPMETPKASDPAGR